LMMALSLVVLGAGARATATLLLLFLAVTPAVGYLVAPYAATDWLAGGLHVADGTVGWVTLRYLFVDGNYPLISWMAFPLMGILFWQTARDRTRTTVWLLASLAVAVVAYAIAADTAPAGGAEAVRRWIYRGWTPTSAAFPSHRGWRGAGRYLGAALAVGHCSVTARAPTARAVRSCLTLPLCAPHRDRVFGAPFLVS